MKSPATSRVVTEMTVGMIEFTSWRLSSAVEKMWLILKPNGLNHPACFRWKQKQG
jgi:hypothetical protein